MSYTISEVAKMLNVSAYTIRYYDKEGLFPNVKRVNGIRAFEDKDMPWLRTLNCLKNIGMPIRKIKEYIDLCLLGDSTLEQRYEMVLEQEKSVKNQIKYLQENLKQIEFKKSYYTEAIKAGTEDVVKNWPSQIADMNADIVPKNNKENK